MTTDVRTVEAGADVADLARLFVDERLRSVPVLDRRRLVGIVSRRDLLRTVARPDDQLRAELLRLIESYDGDLDGWDVAVSDGVATARRTDGIPGTESEEGALRALARTVRGLAGVRVLPAGPVAETRGDDVLSEREERIWDEIVGSQPGRRRPGPRRALPAVVIGGGWGAVLLLLFGVPMAALAVGAATGLIWLLWRFFPEVGGLPEQEDAAPGDRSGTTPTFRR